MGSITCVVIADRYWGGDAPAQCDICQDKILSEFVDGKTQQGPWANMCRCCHKEHGCGLGTGKGQKYQKQNDGRWLKVGG